jgi:hypothetical protein
MRIDRALLAISAVCVVLAASGCAIIGGIFKAGAVTGIVGVVVLAAVVLLVVSRFSKSG